MAPQKKPKRKPRVIISCNSNFSANTVAVINEDDACSRCGGFSHGISVIDGKPVCYRCCK